MSSLYSDLDPRLKNYLQPSCDWRRVDQVATVFSLQFQELRQIIAETQALKDTV